MPGPSADERLSPPHERDPNTDASPHPAHAPSVSPAIPRLAAMMSIPNPDVTVDAKALRMLENDLLAWFVTTARDGTPRAVPVWFLWHEGRVIVMSEPQTGKVAAVRRGAPVLVHLQAGGPFGDDVVILHGAAEISEQTTTEWLAENRDAYVGKYAEAIADYGASLDDIAVKFSTIIVFTPERIQTW